MTRSTRRTARPRTDAAARWRDCKPGTRCQCPPEYSVCMTLTTLRSVKLSTELFSWDNSGLVAIGSVEASELAGLQLPERILNIEEPSAGFILKSHRTGTEIDFGLVSVVTDSENDVLYWEFKPFGSNPSKPVTVIVYND